MNGSLFWIIIITCIAGMGGTGIGGLAGALLGRNSDKIISVLLNLAAGVMLSVVCFDLINDALLLSGIPLVFSGVILGFAVIFLLNSFIDRFLEMKSQFQKTSYIESSSNIGLISGGAVMAAAIALHNLPEGMVIGASLARTDSASFFSLNELAVAFVIGLHDIPEGMAVSVPLISGGLNKSFSVLLTFLTGLPTVIGAVIGFKLGCLSPLWLSLSLSFAAGAMLYVVFGELLPDSVLMWRSKLSVFAAILGILIGIFIIFI